METEINLIKNAVAGDCNSQFKLGRMYRDGVTVDVDVKKAIKWFTSASDSGHIRAKYELSRLLEEKGNKSQLKKVPVLLEESASAGDKDAAMHLAHLYLNGKYIPEDQKRAAELLRFCSDNGSSSAKLELAELLYRSESSESRLESIKLCYELAVTENNKDAMFRLYLCYRYAIGTKKNLKLAEYWVQKAIDAGHTGAVKELESLKQ